MYPLVSQYRLSGVQKIICAGSLFVFSLCAFANESRESTSAVKPDGHESCQNFNIDPLDVAQKKSSRVEAAFFEPLQGKTIRDIRFHQLNVFDESKPGENNYIYRFLNKAHIKTRPKVVAAQLLFKSGDKVNHKAMEETERNLRARKYLTNAFVLPERVCGDYVDVVVVTQDAWALEPQVSFSRKSDDNQTGFAVSDGNVFGTGNSVQIGYKENQIRNTVSYEFSNPYFLNRPLSVRALYQDSSDGRSNLLSVSRPFYSLDTAWATGAQVSDLIQIEEIRSRGEKVNAYLHQAVYNEVYYGQAIDVSEDSTQRLLVGFTEEDDSFYQDAETQQSIPDRDKAVYPWVEYQYLQNRFGVFKNLNQIQRPEDISVGQTLRVRIGYAGTSFGNPDDVIRYKAEYTNAIDFADVHLLEIGVELDGRQHLKYDNLDPSILTSSIAYHYMLDAKNRWYAKMEFGMGENLSQHKELTVGDITGLRGYPTDFLRGDRRYVFTLERRYFSNLHIFNLFRLGGVVFFDTGKAWGLPNQGETPVLADVGIGLRFSSTKVRIRNLIRIDIARPLTAKEGIDKYQLTIGAFQKF